MRTAVRIPRLILVFAGRTSHFVCFAARAQIQFICTVRAGMTVLICAAVGKPLYEQKITIIDQTKNKSNVHIMSVYF